MMLRDMGCEAFDASDHDDADGDSLMRLFTGAAATAAHEPVFAPLEEQVVTLAAHDSLASLEAPGLIERAARLLFGLRAASRALADERLEALRRAVVVTRHRRHLPDAIASDLRERGFTPVQLLAVEVRALG